MKVLVLGASQKEERYSNKAIKLLRKHNHQVYAHGLRQGKVVDVDIETDLGKFPNDIDTVTVYLSPKNQLPFYDFILNLKPRRILLNPGTENDELRDKAEAAGIEVEEACTLVLLNTGQF